MIGTSQSSAQKADCFKLVRSCSWDDQGQLQGTAAGAGCMLLCRCCCVLQCF
jgi:hypothetical protein